ncbi:hypothetical protein CEXT_708431 [Caerostris extrusa]|uniref:Uncharacterized protein n=1 Tax=Caerostris extrusa TaxID=172846 RepID=A0AAV4SW95_CAEEX|nr:hypothetical protein CEXT_708431 [Caerostris extrusa]
MNDTLALIPKQYINIPELRDKFSANINLQQPLLPNDDTSVQCSYSSDCFEFGSDLSAQQIGTNSQRGTT